MPKGKFIARQAAVTRSTQGSNGPEWSSEWYLVVQRSPVLEHLRRLLDEYRSLDDGEVASYIPELGRAYPSWFGIVVVPTGRPV